MEKVGLPIQVSGFSVIWLSVCVRSVPESKVLLRELKLALKWDWSGVITINVPLFKKLRDIIFFCGKWLIKWWSQKKIMSQKFLNSGTLVILCTQVLLLCVVVCKRGGEVSLTPVQIPADAVLCYRFWRQSLIMSSSPSQGQKRRWYSGEHSCLQSSQSGFISWPTQFCVT
jgi:hypothetical protein